MSNALQAPIIAGIFLVAMTFENATKGLFLSISKFQQTRAPIPAIMIVANFLALGFSPLYAWSQTTSTYCQSSTLAFKIVMHSFFFSFNCFLLFKTWIVSRKRTVVLIGAIILLISRATWGVLDCFRSHGVQLPVGCFYVQDRLGVIGTSANGILVDIFCTATTIMSAFRDVDDDAPSKMHRIYRILIADNVLRTLSIMACNAFTLNYAMYGSLQIIPQAPTILILIPAISQFVYCQAINVEFFWINVRNEIMKEPEREEIKLTSVQVKYDDKY